MIGLLRSFRTVKLGLATTGMVFAISASPAAAVTTVASGAYGVYANLTVVNVLNASVGPVSAAAGNAPAPYNDNASVAALNASLGLGALLGTSYGQNINTGLLTSHAAGGGTSAFGTATVNDVFTNLFFDPPDIIVVTPPVTLLGLSATTIRSTSTAMQIGVLGSASGNSFIQNLNLTGLALGGLVIDGSLFVNPAPNTVVLNLLGIKIVLNEQLFSGNGTTDAGIQTNALHVMFSNYLLGTRRLNGDVIVGHSEAEITVDPFADVLPEPAIWAQMIVGFGMIGAVIRRRRMVPTSVDTQANPYA